MSGATPPTRRSDLNADNPWAAGHSIETLRRVAAGIVPDVGDFEALPVDAGGVHAEWIIANGNRRDPAVVLYLHGGFVDATTLMGRSTTSMSPLPNS